MFVNSTLEEVARRPRTPALTIVQLHGDEGPAFCAEVARRTGAKVIKAIRVRSAADVHGAEAFRTDFHLFDAYAARGSGRHRRELRLGAARASAARRSR